MARDRGEVDSFDRQTGTPADGKAVRSSLAGPGNRGEGRTQTRKTGGVPDQLRKDGGRRNPVLEIRERSLAREERAG